LQHQTFDYVSARPSTPHRAMAMLSTVLSSILIGACFAQNDTVATAPPSILAAEQACMGEWGPCHESRPCCRDLQCKNLLGGSGKVCLQKQPVLSNQSADALQFTEDRTDKNLTSVEENITMSLEAFAESLASRGDCTAKSQQCHSGRPCCGHMQCENLLGGSGKVCVEKQPQCLQENGVCAGAGQSTQSCCGDMQCKRLLGGSQSRCQKSQPKCVSEDGICGGPGQQTQTCCGDMQCSKLLGGSQMLCKASQPQ